MLYLKAYFKRLKLSLPSSRGLLLLLLLFILIVLRIYSAEKWRSYGKRFQLTGVVSTVYEKRYSSQRFEIQDIVVEGPGSLNIMEGSMVKVAGVFSGGVLKVDSYNVVSLSTPISQLKGRLVSLFERSLHEPDVSLLSGVVLGRTSQIPRQLKDNLITSGTIHLLVASGTNIAIVSSLVFYTFSKLVSRRYSVLLSVFFTWLYAGLIGFQAPIIRAALMSTFAFSFQYLGIPIKSLVILFWTLVLMILIYPFWATQVSFYLSAVATGGILVFDPFLYRLMSKRIHTFPGLKREISVSLSAQLAVAPILLIVFHRISPFAAISTLLVSWIIFPITIIALAASALSFVMPHLSTFLLLLTVPFLRWFFIVVKLFS